MMRSPLLITALITLVGAWPASAARETISGTRSESASHRQSLVQLAQNRDVEVYFDGNGNRVVVDAYTGEVLSVQPRRIDRRAMRRLERERELGRLQRYPDARDYAEYDRRRGDDRYVLYDGRGGVIEGPVDEWGQDPGVPDYTRPRSRQPAYDPDDGYDSGDYQPERFPEPPVAPSGREAGIERAPLPQPRGDVAAAPSTDPSVTNTVPDPSQPPVVTAPPSSAADPAMGFTAREDVAAIQVLLDRAGASPGVIDGKFGSNVDKAFEAYREITGTNLRSTDTAGIKAALAAGGGGAFMEYEISPEDAAGPFVASVPDDYSEKAKLESMAYTSVTEKLAERFHMDEGYLKALNPDANFNRPGTIVRVANTGANVSTKVAHIVADKGRKQVRAYDATGRLVVAYPATIGSSDTPSPTGTHAVSRVAFNPNYTYNPKINFKQGENDKVLTIPPGPNGPVGSIWIALDKPTYGIHGTPEPSKIGKTESHGCVRLTNFDAEELARLVSPGVPVEFIE